MRRTDSVQLIQKLPIVNFYYAFLQEEDLEEFTHDQLRKLSAVLEQLNMDLLEGENKKIHEALEQRSLAHSKKFASKYKGFKFSTNMFKDCYHRKIVEERFNKPIQVTNPESDNLGVANIEPYQDMVVNQQNGNQATQNQVKTEKPKVNRKDIDWNELSSDQEGQDIFSQEQSAVEDESSQKKQPTQIIEDEESDMSYDLENNEQQPNVFQQSDPLQKYRNNPKYRELTKQEAEQTFQSKILVNDAKSGQLYYFIEVQDEAQQTHENKVQKTSPDHTGRFTQIDFVNGLQAIDLQNFSTSNNVHFTVGDFNFANQEPQQIVSKGDLKAKGDSDEDKSFSVDSQIDEDLLREWVRKDTQKQKSDQQIAQKNVSKEYSSYLDYDDSDDDQSQDFQDIKDKKVDEQRRKQIHPTLMHYNQYYQKNLERNQKQTQNHKHQIVNQNSKQAKLTNTNAIDYSKDRQWR